MKKVFVACVACFTGMILLLQFSCSQPDDAEIERHVKDIEAKRAWKDKHFMQSRNSPLTPDQIKVFSGLNYFKADDKYRVKARFIKIKDPIQFKIHTSTGENRIYKKTGELRFRLGWSRYSLMTYQDKDYAQKKGYENALFVPFTDETTGRQSYGGGRYLDLTIPANGETLVLDFNLAYNPYCAYNYNYSCPIPPRENHLPVKILAGEKKLK